MLQDDLPAVLNGTLEAAEMVFPVPFTRERLEIVMQSIYNPEIGVLSD